MELNQFPHIQAMAANPALAAKFSPELNMLVKHFQSQYDWINKEFKPIGAGKVLEKIMARRDRAFKELLPLSQEIADFITTHVAAGTQATTEAKKEIEEIVETKKETTEELKELMEDLQEFIESESEESIHMGGMFFDRRKVVNQVKNPNYGRKYKLLPDGSKEYV